jgi:LuxR family maltose regulon positive regulatory protein
MLRAFCDHVRLERGVTAHGITAENAAFFLEHLDLLTPEEVRAHPLADYLRAVVYLNTLELDKAGALLSELDRRLTADGGPEALALLGDALIMTGALHMMTNREDFGRYFERAFALLPNGTNLQNTGSLMTQNNNSFSMADSRPGARRRMERAVHFGVPWANRVLRGGMSGLEYIFSAEAAYLTYRLDEARQNAYRAIYKAEPNGQHDLACNGYCLLARIGLLEGDLAEMTRQVQAVEAYAEKYSIGVLKDIRDTALGWYCVKLHDLDNLPRSLTRAAEADKPLLDYDRSVVVYANYLINTGQYAQMVGMLESPVGLYLSDGIWQDRICARIMLAIGYQRLGDEAAALEAFGDACEMTRHNDLITLFIEAEGYACGLVELARRRKAAAFDAAWLDRIDEQAAAFGKRAAAVRAAYQKQNPARAADSPLTPRELDILRALAMGMTREEIAAQQFISVNTVKTFIRNIYNKLDAANRAEAVSIAISRGYIEAGVSSDGFDSP